MPVNNLETTPPSPSGTSEEFQTGRILVLSLCHFVHDVYSSFLSPLLPLLIEKLSMSLTQAGFLSSVMQIPALLNPYIGILADRISVRFFIILAPALTAIPMSLIGVAPSYGILLILLFITGISVAIFHVPSPVMISRLSGSKKGRGMSFYMTGGEFARAVGPLVAVGAVSLLGLEGFYPIMIFGLAASLWLYFNFRDVPITVDQDRKLSVLETWREMRYIMLPLTAILLARGFMHASLTAFLPTFIKLETGNLWLAGIALTVFEITGVAGIFAAMFAGVLVAALFGVVTVYLCANQVIAGLVIVALGAGVTGVLGADYISKTLPGFKAMNWAGLADISIVGPILFKQNILTDLAFLLVAFVWYALFKTLPGLRLRAVGEEPATAAAVGR